MPNIGQLRQLLSEVNARWTTVHDLHPQTAIVEHALGVASPDKLVLASTVPKKDLRKILAAFPTTNPFLSARRQALNFKTLPLPESPARGPIGSTASVPEAGTRPAEVDWRSRWGWPWVTQVKDQGSCGSCVSFGATCVIECMTRIEHAVWCLRSEGDAHDGIGYKCSDGSWPDTYFNWIKDHGICDPDCYPYRTDNPPYDPCWDRSGRTVRLDSFTELGSIDDQKTWIDAVGPITGCFEVFQDFDAYGSGVYHHVSGNSRGWHCITIVGYSDTEKCWIVKNSWGSGWGDHGYVKIGYGEASIEKYAKYGVPHVNPDPWTKRRLHNGNLYESGNGALHRNFEMLATTDGSGVRHWWRDNTAPGFPWAHGSDFGNDAAVCPSLTGTTYNRNFEAVYLTTGSRLHHWWLDQNNGRWNDGGVFGPNDAAGVPGFIQSNYGGNFEVVVRTRDSKLNHWWRDGSGWHDGGRFGNGVRYSGPSLLQSNYGTQGNFELVCVMDNGTMQHWWRDNDHGNVWTPGRVFGTADGPPCMIQGQFGMATERGTGNFELCVASGGQVHHWWRDNQDPSMQWSRSAIFGHDVLAVAGLLEGSFGFNLEVVVLRRDWQLQHYWRDGAGWHEGPVIGPAMAIRIVRPIRDLLEEALPV